MLYRKFLNVVQCYFAMEAWRQVAGCSGDAAVFLDNCAGELLHYVGGVQVLGEPVGVYNLYSSLNPVARNIIAQAPYCHVVMVVTTPLLGTCAERISSLLTDLQPLFVHLFCAVSEALHAELVPIDEDCPEGGYSHYGEFQGLMRKWINRESGVRVSVSHLKLSHAEVVPGLTVVPPSSSLLPLLPSDLPSLQQTIGQEDPEMKLDSLEDLHFPWLPHQLQVNFKSFVCALNDLLEEVDMKEDIFSLGSTSRLLANQLALLPAARARRKSASQRCSLLFVDRSLDLAACSLHTTEGLGDQIVALLPSLPGHSCGDVAVNMAPICTDREEGMVVPGCLAQYAQRDKMLLRTILTSKRKEVLMEVARALNEALSKEKLSVKPSGRLTRPSSGQLRVFLEQFKGQPSAVECHSGVLQLACAVVETIEHEYYSSWEQLASDEKVLLMGAGDQQSDSIVKQLHQIISQQLTRSDGVEVRLVDLLAVVMAMYSVFGEDCYTHHSEETQLKALLVDMIAKQRKCDQVLLQQLEVWEISLREDISQVVEEIFTVLNRLTESRNYLNQFRETYKMDENSYKPLLVQLVEAIFNPSRPDLPDVNHHSYGLTDKLMSSISLFMSSVRPRPDTHPTLYLVVVGGVALSEVRCVHEAVAASKTGVRVEIITTKLLSPAIVTQDFLGKNRQKN